MQTKEKSHNIKQIILYTKQRKKTIQSIKIFEYCLLGILVYVGMTDTNII